MQRIYLPILHEHLLRYRQMIFLTGPRQVGKTTIGQLSLEGYDYKYLNWDNITDKQLILSGIDAIYDAAFDAVVPTKPRAIIFDEIHKYRQWKTLLKGYFDSIHEKLKIVVIGSAKLNVYRKGGDSMMGRYFLYRVHPLSVGECIHQNRAPTEIIAPQFLPDTEWERLLKYGGFPEPFLANDPTFYQRWQNLKHEQLFREDLRELTQVHDLARLELLAHILTEQITGTLTYSSLATKVRVSEPTIRHWIDILVASYYCFTIKPWSKNVTRSLIKEPKVYLWDWSVLQDPGARIENMVANHLLKAVHWWTDVGLGKYELFYLRDKDKREVDFLVCKNDKPWLMVEVKNSGNNHISPHLNYFYNQLNPTYACQLVFDMPYQELDCFALKGLYKVPMRTFLSQLV